MATDDRQILVTGSASAPATFTVPGNGQIRPKAVFAHFDGSGAAGAFLPALKVTSDGGKLVGIYPCATAIAAGASAEVSWFPHLAAAASSPATSGGVPWCTIAAEGEAFDINDTGAVILLNVPQDDFYTESPSIYDWALLDSGGNPPGAFGGVQFLTGGLYRMTLMGRWAALEVAAQGQVDFSIPGVGARGRSFLWGRTSVLGSDAYSVPTAPNAEKPQTQSQWLLNVFDVEVPVGIVFWGLQTGATVTQTIEALGVLIEQLGTTAAANFFEITGP